MKLKKNRKLIVFLLVMTIITGALSLSLMLINTIRGSNNTYVNIDFSTIRLVQTLEPKEGDPIAIVDTTLGEIRFVLYPKYSPQAVKNFTELLETVELQEFYVPRRDADHIKGMDSKFHQLLYRFSGSAVLNDTLLPLHKKVQKFRLAAVENGDRASHSAKEHRAIYEALAAHDPDLAERTTHDHIANAAKHIKIEL